MLTVTYIASRIRDNSASSYLVVKGVMHMTMQPSVDQWQHAT